MTDLEELERLAKGASPGPWRRCTCGRCGLVWGNGDREFVCTTLEPDEPCRRDGNANYIAALNPNTVLWMIQRIRLLEQALGPKEKKSEPSASKEEG